MSCSAGFRLFGGKVQKPSCSHWFLGRSYMNICKLGSKELNQALCIAGETHNSGLCNKDKTKTPRYDADHKTSFYGGSPGTCPLQFCCHFTGCCQTSLPCLPPRFVLSSLIPTGPATFQPVHKQLMAYRTVLHPPRRRAERSTSLG